MARFTLRPNDNIPAGGDNAEIFFNETGQEVARIEPDTSGTVFGFQRGGEILRFSRPATEYTITTSSNNVTITHADGTNVTFAVGSTAGTLQFGGSSADSRSISFTNGAVVLGGQTFQNGTPDTVDAGPNTYAVASADGLQVHDEGTTVTFTITRTTTVGAETLTFGVSGDTNGGQVNPAQSGQDFLNAGGSVSFLDGEASKQVTVTIATDNAIEGTEGYRVTVFKGAQTVASAIGLITDTTASNNVGQTFILTNGPTPDNIPGMVGSNGNTDTSRNDTIIGDETSTDFFDNIDAGAGNNDTFRVVDTGTGGSAPQLNNLGGNGGIDVQNVENFEYQSVRGLFGDALNITTGTIPNQPNFVGLKTATFAISSNNAQTITSASTLEALTITNFGTGDINVVGGGGALRINPNLVPYTGDVNVGQTGVTNGFTSVAVNFGDDLNIAEVNASTLSSLDLNGFSGNANLDIGNGAPDILVRNLTSGAGQVIDIDTSANPTLRLQNVTGGIVDVNSEGSLTIVSQPEATAGGSVSIDDITVGGGTLTIKTDGRSITADDVFGGSLTTVNLDAASGSITIGTIPGALGRDVVITGAGAVSIDQVTDTGTGGDINGTANSGGITIATQLGTSTEFDGGSGADTVIFGATTQGNTLDGGADTATLNAGALGVGGSIDAGVGAGDTLLINSANAASISSIANNGLSNFNILHLTPAQLTGVTDAIDVANIGFEAGANTYVRSEGASPASVAEVTTITFGGTATGQDTGVTADTADSLTFDGVTVLFDDGDVATGVGGLADDFATQYNAAGTGQYTAVANLINGTVTLINNTAGPATDLAAGDFVFTDKTNIGAPAVSNVTTTVQGVTAVGAVTEVTTLELNSVTVANNETVTIGNGTASFTYTNTDGFNHTQAGADLATELKAAADADADFFAAYETTVSGDDVIFTARNGGDLPDLSVTGTGLTGADDYDLTVNTQGANAVAAANETFTATIVSSANGNDTVSFDGITWTASGTENTNEAVALAFATFYNTQGGRTYNAAVANNVITFTSIAPGDRADNSIASFTIVDDTNVGTPSVAVSSINPQGSNGGITLNNYTNNGTLEISGATGGGHVVNLAANTAADALNLLLSDSGNLGQVDITSGGSSFETLNIDTDNSVPSATDTITVLENNELDNVTVVGVDSLNLTLTGTGIVSFDASGQSGGLTWTTGALANAATIETGSGTNNVDYSLATQAVTFIGGSGDDNVTNNVAPGTIDFSAGGNDNLNVAVPTSGGNYSTVIGFSTELNSANTDRLTFDGATSFVTTKVTLANPAADLQDYLDAANAGLNDGSIQWFNFGGNTYVVQDNSNANTFQPNVDTVVELQGTLDLSGLELVGGQLANFV